MKRSARPVVVPALEWRNLQKQGTVAGIARAVVIERATDGAVSFIASSMDADRYGDTIDQAGWVTDNFRANPVLLWAHSHDCPPVGKVGKIGPGVNGNLTASEITFTPAEMHAFGDEVGQMVRGGFLNTVSVGFLPLEWEERYDKEGRFLGYHFSRCELLEISVVPVPANPQALIEGRAFTKSLATWCATPDESAPMARSFQQQVAGFLKAGEDLQASAAENADGDALMLMVTLLQQIAADVKAIRTLAEADAAEDAAEDVADPACCGSDPCSCATECACACKACTCCMKAAPVAPVADPAPVGDAAPEADPFTAAFELIF